MEPAARQRDHLWAMDTPSGDVGTLQWSPLRDSGSTGTSGANGWFLAALQWSLSLNDGAPRQADWHDAAVRAAIEPAVERREYLVAKVDVTATGDQPQWSPPLREGARRSS